MATVSCQATVTFTGSSPENISYAKDFWKAVDATDFDIKSTLHVPGVNHRLATAPASTNRNAPTYFHQMHVSDSNGDQHPGFIKNVKEAQKRLEIEEDEYVNRILQQKTQQKIILSKQKQERLKKEAIRESVFAEEMNSLEDDDQEVVCEDEAIQAMNDIDKFDRMVKLAKEQLKENAN